MVVTGEFDILGDNDQGSFDNDGLLYLFDGTPGLKTGLGYEDFTCGSPVDSCTIYTEADLLASPLAPFYLAGSYSISAGGPVLFCAGDSVRLSVTDTASAYQWFEDDVEILGETSHEYWAKTSADYHVTFFVEGDSLVMDVVSVTVNALPVVTISGLDASYCEGSETDTLVGGPPDGFFLPAAGYTILGNDSAVFDPAAAGNYPIKYYYTDLNGCTDTATVTAVVNSLPVVTISGLNASYCEGSETDTLIGGPADGFFLPAASYTILGGDSAVFDPTAAGNYPIKYYYTDLNGCTDTSTVSALVNSLPLVTFTGFEAEYCENGPQDTLTGSQAGGTFLGTGITDNADGTAYFDPIATGNIDITYYYTDGNGCSDTSIQSVTVHPLPTVSFSGLAAEYCFGENQDTLIGSQTGGTYLGNGITDNANGTAYFDPTVSDTYDITYFYTNANGCIDTALQSVTVHPLPVVDYAGLSTDLCVMEDPDTLVGNQAPAGSFFGGTIVDQGDGTGIFTPLTDGIYNIYYAYTDGNGCRDSIMYSVTVHPLPVVSIGAYDTIYDISDPSFFIAGTPPGGIFTGKGISGITYDPAIATGYCCLRLY
jgi:hypothetical protein